MNHKENRNNSERKRFCVKFAKHHVPEVHPKDTDEYVERRVKTLIQEGAVAACVAVQKTESKNAMDLLARLVRADEATIRLAYSKLFCFCASISSGL